MPHGQAVPPAGDSPPFHAILAVDAMRFGANSDGDQRLLANLVQEVLGDAFVEVAGTQVWRRRQFRHAAGDGHWFCCHTKHLASLLALLDVLQELLERRAVCRRAEVGLRLRASIHVGPVATPKPGEEVVGSAVVTTHRLLDSEPLRDALDRSEPGLTHVAAMLSRHVFESVIANGIVTAPADRFVARTVKLKETNTEAYLYVPCPSGDLLRNGFGEPGERGTEGAPGALVVHGGAQGIYQPLVCGNIVNVAGDTAGDRR